ncbi:MAG TPA: phospholipid scramblase-related protein [Chitinophagaceae bacterium]
MMTAEPKAAKSIFFPEFFESNDYFIDEKVAFLKFHNEYKVYDNTATQVGTIVQRVSGWHKFLRLFLNKALFPFTLEVIDNNAKVLVTIRRGWTFWLSRIDILGAEGAPVGFIKQKFRLLKPRFQIFGTEGEQIAEINGDWKAWNFGITSAAGNPIGSISKKWAGVAKELFTSADKYYVTIDPAYAEDRNKIAIVATAITIDMVLKESK